MSLTTPHPPQRDSGAWQKNPLRHLLEETDEFVHIVELVTSRGLITKSDGRKVMSLARRLAEHPAFHTLSITDNPGGNAMISPDILGTDLISRGQDCIIHIACKDWNRNPIQGRAWQLASEGFDNILALSGDYPISSYEGTTGAVFDLDSVGLLEMFSDMNSGLKVKRGKKTRRMAKTAFYLGVAINNHKRYEREVMPQYFKLAKEIRAGAHFAVSQIGYDARKQDELLKYMHLHDLAVPAIANVYVLSAPAARFFHKGNIPGVEVTDEFMAVVEEQAKADDKGKAFFIELAAKQCDIARGLGYRGAYLGGHLQYGDYDKVVELSTSYGADDWRDFAKELHFSFADEFYYFKPEEGTGLSSTEVNRAYVASREKAARREARADLPLSYKFNRLVHDRVFAEESAGFRLGARLTATTATARCPISPIYVPNRNASKTSAMAPAAAPARVSAKSARRIASGPAPTIRLKAYGEDERMLDGPVVIKNAGLKDTSAWLNTFSHKDHHGKRKEKK